MRLRLDSRYLRVLALWSVLCAAISQWRIPHVLFICEHIEAFYHGMADDDTVSRAMRVLIAVFWVVGAAVVTACWQVFDWARRAPDR